MTSQTAHHAQDDVVAFLKQELARESGGEVERIDTHISIILMGGERVWKLKKAVHLPYLDFSTPQKRLAACEQELALNRRTAPQLYLRVRRIVRGADDSPLFADEDDEAGGDLRDAIVEMKRFDQQDLFDAMAVQGRLDAQIVTRLARNIADFHAKAEIDSVRSGAHAVEAALHANEGGFAEADIFERADVVRLNESCRKAFDGLRDVLDGRAARGFLRRCHGDLHLRNICMFEGEPTLFDCLEFDEDLARIDVLYDLAFLLMDLWHRDLRQLANILFNRYLDETGDVDALALMPFFMALRAAVRAHVGAAGVRARREDGDTGTAGAVAEAQGYLDLALELADPRLAKLVAVGGLSGSGKSTVAHGIAAWTGQAPGARILSTDRIRKARAGVALHDKLPAESYTAEESRKVYEAQRELAGRILCGGGSVIADAVFLRQDEREGIEQVARAHDATFRGLWLEAPADVLIARVQGRTNDPSDANADVVRMQVEQTAGEVGWTRVDATGSAEDSRKRALAALGVGG